MNWLLLRYKILPLMGHMYSTVQRLCMPTEQPDNVQVFLLLVYTASRYTPACKVSIVVAILNGVNENGSTSSRIRSWSLVSY